MKYLTVVRNFAPEGAAPEIGFEVPHECFERLGLVEGEVLEWNFDDNNDTIQIKKTKLVTND